MGVLFVCLGLLVVGYVTWTGVEPHYHYSSVINGWAFDSFELLVATLCVVRGLIRRPGRGAAIALGVGLLSWALGDVVYTMETLGKAGPWGPTWADVFWLGFYLPAYVGVVLFMRREVRKIADPSWLDGGIAALGAGAVCAAFAFAGLDLAGSSTLTATVYLAYPIGDLLLLALIVGGATLLSGRWSAPWLFLAAAMALNTVGDTFNLFQSSLGTPRADAAFRALAWPTAGLLVCIALWIRPRPRDLSAVRRPAGFVLPGVAAIAAIAVLIVGTFHHVATVALVLAASTMVAAAIRGALSARRLRQLTIERFEQSLTDDLTGLKNRRYLMDVLGAIFAEQVDGQLPGRRLAFLYIDLDGFKVVNDSFGHAAGDELLRQLGPRLAMSLRNGEILVRLGGDEFGVLLMKADLDDADAVALRLVAEIEKPFILEDLHVRVSASVGISFAPDDASDGQALLRCADIAMYRAKLGDSSFAIYDPDLDEEGNLWQLSDELRVAIETGQLELHYQPQLDLRRDVFSAAEALVRWPHPRLGMVSPMRFVQLAEEAGLMAALTSWVLKEALGQCAIWRNSGSEVTVSVNVSPTDLLAPGFVDLVRGALSSHDLPAEALVLEITETNVIANLDHAKRVVKELCDLGIVVSIDDFGAGFTSLAYLSDLAVGELKLDGTFIAGLSSAESKRDRDLVGATIDLGHTMGLRVVAECIEDQTTLDVLRELGCDLGQGYLLSKPVSADRLPPWGQSLVATEAARAG
jgi:diguanylate cyclase